MTRASVVMLCVLFISCSDSTPTTSTFAFQELADQGLTRYLGAARPARDSRLGSGDIVYEFDPTDGPICLHGGQFRAAVRHADSDDLVIFLQGGGVCSSTVCSVQFVDTDDVLTTGVPELGILDAALEANPVRDWNAVYSPYCDGSVMMGDVDRDADGDGQVEYQRGLRNLSAVIDLAKTEFPRPRRILLTGDSAGGFATFAALPLVRRSYPDVAIFVVNDAGVGVGMLGEVGVDGVTQFAAEFNASALLPASCTGCFEQGNLMPLLGWELERDAKVRAGIVSSLGDFVIASTFLHLPAEVFEGVLRSESAAISARFPDRFKRFLYSGTRHTAVAIDSSSDVTQLGLGVDPAFLDMILGRFDVTAVGDVTVAAWVTGMIDGPEWNDQIANN